MFVFTLSDLQQLYALPMNEDHHLVGNIDCGGASNITPIGTTGSPYTGTFYGHGFTISNFSNLGKIDDGTPSYKSGLFAFLSGYVKNLGISGTINRTDSIVGGIAAVLSGGGIWDSWSNVTITAGLCAGGMIGLQTGGYCKRCYSLSSPTATIIGYAGGMVGYVANDSYYDLCYTTGTGSATSQGNFYGQHGGGVLGVASCWASGANPNPDVQFESGGATAFYNASHEVYTGPLGWPEADKWSAINWAWSGSSYPTLKALNPQIEINSWTSLDNIRNWLDKSYILTTDLSKNSTGYKGIGDVWTPISPFSGTFNGQGHTISDIYSVSTSATEMGLFGTVSRALGDNIVENVKLTNLYLSSSAANAYIGGIAVGLQINGIIRNCYVQGTLVGSSTAIIGGIVSTLSDNAGTHVVEMCKTDVFIVGGSISGGISGGQNGVLTMHSQIKNCYALGKIANSSSKMGQLVGRNIGNIINCYSDAELTASNVSLIAGLSGDNAALFSDPQASISDSFCLGDMNFEKGTNALYPYISSSYNGFQTNTYNTNTFQGCSELREVYFEGGNTKIGNGIFSGAHASLRGYYYSPSVYPNPYAGVTMQEWSNFAFTYTLSGNNATLTGWVGARPTALIVPDTIDGHPVVAIVNNIGFANLKTITSLYLGTNLTSIGNNLVNGCSNITGNLTIPSGVTFIGTGAFSRCSGLTGNLTIPSGVTNMQGSTFESCSGFNGTLTIPSSVTYIGNSEFHNCSGFTSVYFHGAQPTVGSDPFLGVSPSLQGYYYAPNIFSNPFQGITMTQLP